MNLDKHMPLKGDGTPDVELTGERRGISGAARDNTSWIAYSAGQNRKMIFRAVKKALSWLALIAVTFGAVHLAWYILCEYCYLWPHQAAPHTFPFLCAGTVCAYVKFRADRIEKLLKEDKRT